MRKRQVPAEEARGGTGVLREHSCRWFTTWRGLLTMEGRFQEALGVGGMENLLRGFRRRQKVRENKGTQAGPGRELPFFGLQAFQG